MSSGLGQPEVSGPPRLSQPSALDHPCPNCGGMTVFALQVEASHPGLRGHKGIGTYCGCAACPWASPMVILAAPNGGNGD